MDGGEDIAGKRRRKLIDDEHRENEIHIKQITIPKSPNSHAPSLQFNQDCDDENLIRETQAALKTLSGSWLREQTISYTDGNENASGFENLFNDKRCEKMLPSSPSHSSSESVDCGSPKSFSIQQQIDEQSINGISDNEMREEFSKSDNDNNGEEYSEKYHSKYSYDATNFLELVDSSSNELEIDISDGNDDKYGVDQDSKGRKDNAIVNKQSLYNAYKAATAGLPYSTQSAFKPPAEVKHRIHNNSFPSEPFGGYSNDHDSKKGLKQYTVLQPAGAGSRAASALQEARALPSTQPSRDSRPLSALSPPISRGSL